MKGQISAEMVILLVIIIAVVALVASNLFSGAKKASTTFEEKVGGLTESINNTCFTDIECQEDFGSNFVCSNGVCVEGG